jgi:hypothetical protein
VAEPRRAAVAEKAAGDDRISPAIARVLGEDESALQSGRRSRYSGKPQGEFGGGPAVAVVSQRPASRRRRRNRLDRLG